MVVAGGFSYGDALGAGRMLALDLTDGRRRRLGERCGDFVAGGGPVHRHLQRVPGAHPGRAAARRPRPQRRRPLRLPVGRARRRADVALRLDSTTRPTVIHCPIAHGEGRYVHPDPDGARRRRPGGAALRRRQPQRLGRRHRRRVRRDRPRARADAPPREPRASRRQHPRHRHDPATADTLGLGLFRSAVDACRRDADRSTVRRHRPAAGRPARGQGAGVVPPAATTASRRACSSPPTGCRRSTAIIAGVPYKGQVLNQLAAWWFARTASIVANHVVAVPDPNVLDRPRARRRCRSRWSCAARSPASRRRRCGSATPPGRGRSTATTSPTGCAKNTLLPDADRHADHQAAGRVRAHDEPLTWAEVVERGLVAARPLGAGDRRRPRAVPRRPADRRRRPG